MTSNLDPDDVLGNIVQHIEDSLRLRALGDKPVCESDEKEHERIHEMPLFDNSQLTFHHLGLIISATFGMLAVVISFFLIWRHVSHYLRPYEQKHIVRILLMIPIYAVVSFLSYVKYRHALYFEVLRDCYEAVAIASFFTLMCHYIAPNLHEQKQYFRDIAPKNWVWPLSWMQKCTGGENRGFLRKPQSGLTWFNVVWVAIYQYCFVRPFFTIVAVTTQALGRYCQSSKDPRFAYIWVTAFEAISVTIAMYCLIQFYIQLKTDLAPHRPFLKVLCIKLVIFFCFWQSWVISLLTVEGGPLKSSAKISSPDWKIGLPSMLVCFEMSIFAILHLFAFPWNPYDLKRQGVPNDLNNYPKQYAHGPIRAFASALNPWDIVKAFSRGMRWLFVGLRHRKEDISYQTKLGSVSSATGHAQGPTFAGNGEPATELAENKHGSADSDTAGLLSNAQAEPYVRQESYYTQPYGSSPYNPNRLPTAPTPGQEYGIVRDDGRRFPDFETQDTSYHGAAHSPSPHRYEEQDLGRLSTEWDMFAGATRPGAPGTSGSHPPKNGQPGWI